MTPLKDYTKFDDKRLKILCLKSVDKIEKLEKELKKTNNNYQNA